MAGLWLCHHLWEHYLFTLERTFLKEDIKEKNIFNSSLCDYKDVDYAIEELATFHHAKEIVDKS